MFYNKRFYRIFPNNPFNNCIMGVFTLDGDFKISSSQYGSYLGEEEFFYLESRGDMMYKKFFRYGEELEDLLK